MFTDRELYVLFAGCMGQLDISSIFSGRSDQEPVYETGEANSANNASEIREKLSKIDAVINEYYLNESEIDEEKMIEGIYSGYVAGLGENYTTYYTAQEYADLMESSSGEYSGIGVSVSQSIETGVITIVNPFENGPGYEAGMRKDDILFAVEGEEVTGQDINSVVAKIKGEAGTTVDLTVYRPSTDEYIDMTVERRVVQNPTVTYEMKDGNIGYIQVTEFDEVTVEQFSTAISDLQGQGMQGLVVDLRDNPADFFPVCAICWTVSCRREIFLFTLWIKTGTVRSIMRKMKILWICHDRSG